MQLEISRFKIPIEVNNTILLDMEDLFRVDESIVDVSMSTLPWDAEHIQLVVVVTKRSVDEQELFERSSSRSFLSNLPEIDDLD